MAEKRKMEYNNSIRKELYSKMQPNGQKIVNLASEKCALSWLTFLPLADFGFVLNEHEFHDAILLR